MNNACIQYIKKLESLKNLLERTLSLKISCDTIYVVAIIPNKTPAL